MDEIRRLLRVAAERKARSEGEVVRVRLNRELNHQLRERLDEDGIALTVFMEAVCRGYVRRHHAILAMIDQWIRDERPDSERSGPKLNSKDLDEIYAAVRDGGNVDDGG